MKTRLRWLSRPGYVLAAAALMTLGLLPALTMNALAAQVSFRSITMSNSTGGATGVDYKVAFTAPSNATVKGIIVDFCSNDPIIGDSCTLPSGFSLSGVTVDTTTSPDTGLTGTWTATPTNSNRTLELTNATGTALNNTAVIFTISGVANPTANNTSFYARILTYANDSGANSPATYAAGTEGTFIDYGGIALSTASPVSITVRVMESLTFCASAADISGDPDCTNATAPNLTLGTTIGSNVILDGTTVYPASVYTKLATNAQHGAAVLMKNTNSSAVCGSLSSDGGATCGITSVGATPVTIAAGDTSGNAAFGMCVAHGANTTVATPYIDGSVNNCPATYNASSTYGFDDTGVLSSFGSELFHTTGAVLNENNRATFVATASLTTPAAIYTGTYSLIATGTF